MNTKQHTKFFLNLFISLFFLIDIVGTGSILMDQEEQLMDEEERLAFRHEVNN